MAEPFDLNAALTEVEEAGGIGGGERLTPKYLAYLIAALGTLTAETRALTAETKAQGKRLARLTWALVLLTVVLVGATIWDHLKI